MKKLFGKGLGLGKGKKKAAEKAAARDSTVYGRDSTVSGAGSLGTLGSAGSTVPVRCLLCPAGLVHPHPRLRDAAPLRPSFSPYGKGVLRVEVAWHCQAPVLHKELAGAGMTWQRRLQPAPRFTVAAAVCTYHPLARFAATRNGLYALAH